MKWILFTGTWRLTNKEVENDVDRVWRFDIYTAIPLYLQDLFTDVDNLAFLKRVVYS